MIFGYKVHDKEYFEINYFLTILSFSIFKSYYLSDQKNKEINVFKLFTSEYCSRIKENNKGYFLGKIKKKSMS